MVISLALTIRHRILLYLVLCNNCNDNILFYYN